MIISLGSRGERELRIFAKGVKNAFFFLLFFSSLVSISNKEYSEHTSSNCGYGFVVLTKLSKWLKYILIKGVHTRGCSLPHAMMESTKSGQEGQRKYNTNGKRMNRRGVMVLGMLKRGGHVSTDAPASNLLVAQCHWEQNVRSLTVSCLLLANCHASTTVAYNNRVLRLFLLILYNTFLLPVPQLRDSSTCIPLDAFAKAQVKKLISIIGDAHKLCKNFWTSQPPKLQVSAFYFPEAMSNLFFGFLCRLTCFACVFLYTKNELQNWPCTILIKSCTELFSHVQIFPKFT